MKNGTFITFEGGEGAGKSSVIAHIAAALRLEGFEVLCTREPGGTPLGEQIRHWLLDNKQTVQIGDTSELFLFLAARAQHLAELIRPALKRGYIVLCDRFNDSTIAYQGAARGLGVEYVEKLCRLACHDTLPDITLLLDVPTEAGLQRTRAASKENAKAGEVDRIESEKKEFHEKVRQALLALAAKEPDRYLVIDASQTLHHVQQEAKDKIFKSLSRYV
jgi:dTMP kinase